MPYSDNKKRTLAKHRAYLRRKEAHTISSNQHRAKRRKILRDIVLVAKQGISCADCKGDFPYYVMEFDHVRGEKLGAIAVMVHIPVAQDVLEKEIAKCELVCANCHRERTFKRQGNVAERPNAPVC